MREATPAFYLYRQRMGDRVQTGIVACVSIAEYEAGRIRRHELTRADKERERTSYRYRRGADGTGLPYLPGAGGDRPPDGAGYDRAARVRFHGR